MSNIFFFFSLFALWLLNLARKRHNREWQVKKVMVWNDRHVCDGGRQYLANTETKTVIQSSVSCTRNILLRVTKIMFDNTRIQSIFGGQAQRRILSSQTKLVWIQKMSDLVYKHRTVRLGQECFINKDFKMSFRVRHRRAKRSCYIQYEVLNHINIYLYIYILSLHKIRLIKFCISRHGRKRYSRKCNVLKPKKHNTKIKCAHQWVCYSKALVQYSHRSKKALEGAKPIKTPAMLTMIPKITISL